MSLDKNGRIASSDQQVDREKYDDSEFWANTSFEKKRKAKESLKDFIVDTMHLKTVKLVDVDIKESK